MPEGFRPPQGLKLTDTITRAGADSLRNQAIALKTPRGVTYCPSRALATDLQRFPVADLQLCELPEE